MNRRALLTGCGAFAVASVLPIDPTYAVERIWDDGYRYRRVNDRWFLADA